MYKNIKRSKSTWQNEFKTTVLASPCTSCILPPPHPLALSSLQMWSRWPSTGSPETSTLLMTWTTGSSCVTRMGWHVSPSWTRSCTTPKASPWTPPWGWFDILLFALCINTLHGTGVRCGHVLLLPNFKQVEMGKRGASNWVQMFCFTVIQWV